MSLETISGHTERAKINEQVSQILNAQSFKSSRILCDFLHYVVSETLNGNEQYLKEYTIAIHVLKKNAGFNPQLDPIVRIHASRLRRALDIYYQHEGLNDSIKISVPKGRYIPVFETNSSDQAIKLLGKKQIEYEIETIPIIAVLPFQDYKQNERVHIICSVLWQELSIELTQFQEIKVISNYATLAAREKHNSINDITSFLSVDYLITGQCFIEGNIARVSIELHSVHNNQIIWAETFSIQDFKEQQLNSSKAIIQKVVASTCGFFGIIYHNTLNAHVPQDYDQLYAIYWHNRYHRQFSIEAFQEAQKAVEIGLKKNHNNALLLAFQAEIYLNMKSMDIQGEVDYYKLGSQLIKKAVDLDRCNQHAYQVLSWLNILGHNKREFLLSAEKCLEINPYNVMYRSSIGFGYECIGEYERGFDLMSESLELSMNYHWNMNLGFCLYYFHAQEFDEALLWGERINRPQLLWDPLLRASSLGWINRKEEASLAAKELHALSPNFRERAPYIIDAFLLDKELQNTIIQGLKLAGIEIQG